MAQRKPSLQKKYLLITFLVCVALIYGLGYYKNELNQQKKSNLPFYSKGTINPSLMNLDSWLVYQEKTGSFQFKYRPDLAIKEEEGKIALAYKGPLNSYNIQFNTRITVINNSQIIPENYAKNELCKTLKEGDQKAFCLKSVLDNLRPYSIGKLDGVKSIYNLYESPVLVYILKDKDRVVIFESIGETGELPTELGVTTIEKILSTFEFRK